MEVIKQIEQSENYELLLISYFDERIKDNILSYGVRNKNHGVFEHTHPVLIECQTAMESLEDQTYPKKRMEPPKEPLLN